MDVGTVVVVHSASPAEEPVHNPRSAIRWRFGATISFVCSLAAVLLLVVGLILKTVFITDMSYVYHADTVFVEVKANYYDASFSYRVSGEKRGEQSLSGTGELDLADITCDKKELLKFAAALHFFSIGAAVSLAAALGNELRTKQIKGHLVLVAFIGTSVLLSACNVILAIVIPGPGHPNCYTIVLKDYTVSGDPVSVTGIDPFKEGVCWELAIGALVVVLMSGLEYVVHRYLFKRCCRDKTGTTRSSASPQNPDVVPVADGILLGQEATVSKIQDFDHHCALWRYRCPVVDVEQLDVISSCYSPQFIVGGVPWRIHIQQRTETRAKRVYLAVHLQCLTQNRIGTYGQFKLTVRSAGPQSHSKSKEFRCHFKKSGSAWGLHNFIELDQLLHPSGGFIHVDDNDDFHAVSPSGCSNPCIIIDALISVVKPNTDGSYDLGTLPNVDDDAIPAANPRRETEVAEDNDPSVVVGQPICFQQEPAVFDYPSGEYRQSPSPPSPQKSAF